MKIPPKLILLLLVCPVLEARNLNQMPTLDASWRLAWSDEFNRDGAPDPVFWKAEEGFVRNEELQWFQASNARCHNGVLVIEARREQRVNPHYQAGSRDWARSRPHAEYTSASLVSQDRLSWKFGRFEIRARFSALPGLWPAIWTTGIGNWPHCGEIDIMEFYQGHLLANTVHAGRQGKPEWNAKKRPVADFGHDTWNQRFHLWVMEWDEKQIAIYLDGKLMNRVDLSTTVNRHGERVNPFHAPQQIRLNLSIGSNGGDPSSTPFPQRYEIDYVRIYQKK